MSIKYVNSASFYPRREIHKSKHYKDMFHLFLLEFAPVYGCFLTII